MGTYKENMLAIWEKYCKEVSSEPADLRELGNWAIKKKLWAPKPVDVSASFARDMADILREQVRVDKDGREYRAFIPAKSTSKDGAPLFKWADIDLAPRTHVEKGVQNERRQIANDCFALAMKVEHYNASHPREEPLQIPFNFEEDIEEMKIARGLDDDDKGEPPSGGAAAAA
ncbi:MAG: hypothetical protein ACRECX_03320 [Methyloceanibacter sp.]|uniref:hypothetical protein n=1 Tax=Methyloceanibacter sp. TaxID=1965321 RepID=UPI003D6C9FD7